MNEDFTPFELAVKLKEKGYTQEDSVRYDELGNLYIGDDDYPVCAAPTISQVLKWLREEKKIFIEIALSPEGYRHIIYTGLYCMDTPCAFHFSFDGFYNLEDNYRTYEQATLAGIGYVLDNLI